MPAVDAARGLLPSSGELSRVAMTALLCKHPDHGNPKMVCGYPIPCPYHTVVIDPGAKPVPTVTFPATADAMRSQSARERLAAIGIALAPTRPRRRRPTGI